MEKVTKGIKEIISFESCSIILKELKEDSDRFTGLIRYKKPYLMLSISIIDEDKAIGVILLLSKLKSISSSKLENVEMAADEIAEKFTRKFA